MRISVFLIIILILLMVTVNVAEGQELKSDDLEYETERQYKDKDVNEGFDPRDPDPSHINPLQWMEDFKTEGREMPRGSYVGQYTTPSILRYDYTPRWKNQKSAGLVEYQEDAATLRDSYRQDTGEYGVSIITETYNFSSQDIMNGASEFYVKAPVSPQQLDSITYKAEYEKWIDQNNEYIMRAKTEVKSGLYVFEGKQENFNINGDMTSGIFDLRGDGGQYSHANYMINQDNFYNQSVIQKVNAVVRPDTTYTLAFLAITKDRQPKIKLDEVESDDSQIIMKSMEMEGLDRLKDREYEMSWGHQIPSYIDFNTTKSTSDDLLLSPHFSFVFTSGIGRGGLFGSQLNEEKSVAISDTTTFTEDEETGNYLSHYIPFKYHDDEDSKISPHIYTTLSQNDDKQSTYLDFNSSKDWGNGFYHWSTVNVSSEREYGFNFERFFLWSSYKFTHTSDVSNTDQPTKANVGYYFTNLPENLTFLAKERDENYRYEKIPHPYSRLITDFDATKNESIEISVTERSGTTRTNNHFLGEKMRTYNKNESMLIHKQYKESIGGGNNRSVMEWNTNYDESVPERYFYDIHTSNNFTSGRWNTIKLPPKVEYIDAEEAAKRGMSDKMKIRTRHRNYIVEVKGNVDEVEMEEEEYYELPVPYDILEQPIKALSWLGGYVVHQVSEAIQNNLRYVRESLDKVYATITNFASDVWEAMKSVGEWIHRSVMSVVDFLTELAGHLYDLISIQIEAFLSTFSLMALMVSTYAIIIVTDSLNVSEWRIRG